MRAGWWDMNGTQVGHGYIHASPNASPAPSRSVGTVLRPQSKAGRRTRPAGSNGAVNIWELPKIQVDSPGRAGTQSASSTAVHSSTGDAASF